MTHTWVRHAETGGYWRCPNEALDEMRLMGWEPSDAPPEPNPAIAERLAWEAEQHKLRDTERSAETKPTRAARRGETQED